MTSYDTVNCFKLDGDRLLFFDIFHKNNELVLIMPIYDTPVDHNKIKITHNNIQLKIKEVISKFSREPILILKYNMISINPENIFKVEYNSKSNTYKLSQGKTKINKTLTITTLFKNDYNLIKIFYDYYKKQGVEFFYLYYNGIANDDIKKLHNMKDVLLVNWDFVYWNKGCRIAHHAQMGQMHQALYKYGINQSKYMAFCDYDEYLMCLDKKKSLKQLVSNNNYDTIGFCNIWCRTKNEKELDKFPANMNDVLMNDKIRFGNRSKCIHKTSSIKAIGIHSGSNYAQNKPTIDKNNNMYHFRFWSGKRKK